MADRNLKMGKGRGWWQAKMFAGLKFAVARGRLTTNGYIKEEVFHLVKVPVLHRRVETFDFFEEK